MSCRHCNKLTNWNKILCDDCSKKAMRVLPADPKERVHIYKILIEIGNPITKLAAQQLMAEDVETIEEETLDPTDRMFNTRG